MIAAVRAGRPTATAAPTAPPRRGLLLSPRSGATRRSAQGPHPLRAQPPAGPAAGRRGGVRGFRPPCPAERVWNSERGAPWRKQRGASGEGCGGALGGDAGSGWGRRAWAPSVRVSCSRLILQLIKPNIPDGVGVGLLGAAPPPLGGPRQAGQADGERGRFPPKLGCVSRQSPEDSARDMHGGLHWDPKLRPA